MGMAELERSLRAILKSGVADFVWPRDPRLVTAAEKALGVSFPPTYRKFLTELGAGDVGGREFYGVVDENFSESSVPDGIWLTLAERKEFELPKELVLIADTGTGEYYALDTSERYEDDENPVIVWVAGQSQGSDRLETVARDFGAFLWEAIQQVVDDADSS